MVESDRCAFGAVHTDGVLDVAMHNTRLWILVAVVMSTDAFLSAATGDWQQRGSADEPASAISPDESRIPIFSIERIAVLPPDVELAGREVSADHVEVTNVDRHGFWVSTANGKTEVLVVPAEGSLITIRPGESVDIHGEVRFVRIRPHRPRPGNADSAEMTPYVYAYTVRPAW